MIRTFVSLAKHQREAIPYEDTQRPIQGFLEQGFEVTSSGHLKPNSLGAVQERRWVRQKHRIYSDDG